MDEQAFKQAAEAEAVAKANIPWVAVRHVWKAGEPYYFNVQTGEQSTTPPAGMPPLQRSRIAMYARAIGKPQCCYAKNCTRRNPVHFAEQDHPLDHRMILISEHLRQHLMTSPAEQQRQPAAAAAAVPAAPSVAAAVPAAAACVVAAVAGKKRAAPDAEDAGHAAKRKPTAKQQAKEDERAAREAKKAIGDGIKQGLRLPAAPGSLTFTLRPAVVDLVFQDAIGGAGGGGRHTLKQAELVRVFGTTKIEKGGSRDERCDSMSKPRPVWPASAAQAVDWPRLAEARGSLRHGLALKEASKVCATL